MTQGSRTRVSTVLAFLLAAALAAPTLGAQSAAADSAAAIALLAPGAVILESGSAESVAEYRAHHLPTDIEFARAIKSVRTGLRIQVRGAMAFAAATSTTQGEFKGRAVNSAGAELLVLERGQGGWMISAIHWSSRRRN